MKNNFLFYCLIFIANLGYAQTSRVFNQLHPNDFFKIYAKADSVYHGDPYEAYIVIDTSKIKDPSKIHALFYTTALERKQNKFKISFFPILSGPNTFDITIINNTTKQPDSRTFTLSVYGLRPVQSKTTAYASAEKMPQFNSKTYKNFNDYLLKSFQKEKIKVKGTIIIYYVVMRDGTTKLEQIKDSPFASYEDEEKVKKIIENFRDWIPGEDKGKKVDVSISDLLKF